MAASLHCLLHEAGRISRQRPAVLAPDIRIHYGELDLSVSATAQWLRQAGVQPGQRVALYMEPGWAYVTLLFALWRVGAVACPLNTRWPVQAVEAALRQVACSVLVARVREESRAALEGVTVLDPDGLVSRSLSTGHDGDPFTLPLDQPVSLVFTSGSSGQPKAVLHTYGNHYYSAHGANQHIRCTSQDCWLISLPLYHVGGLGAVFRCVQSGAAMAFPGLETGLAEALATYPVTHFSVVPTQLRRLLAAAVPDEVKRRLKAVLVGGAPVATSLLESARDAGWPVVPTYGLTEMSAMVTAGERHMSRARLDATGAVVRYREVALADDGEILVRGATLCAGAVEGEQVTPVTDDAGWYATGDLGAWTEDGDLRVLGRKDAMLISGGENIHPEEIERILLTMGGVQQAVVVGVADDEYGQRPVAFIERDEAVSDQALQALCEEHLPRFKIPDAFYPWPAELAGGLKADRNALAALAAQWAAESSAN
jgi:o-succinylbenzoate---CoA ligase